MSNTEGDAKIAVLESDDEAAVESSAAGDLLRILDGVRVDDTSDVLEIGCGVGRLGKVFAPICRTWTGCDVSGNMLRHARARLAGFANTRFVELSGYHLAPIADASQDVVYSTVVFMHLSEWDRYNSILEAKRILRPGGQLYVDSISLTSEFGWKMFEQLEAILPHQRPPHISQTSTPQEFEAYLSHAGFASWTVQVVHNAWVVGTAVR